jgi:hypothetical protein
MLGMIEFQQKMVCSGLAVEGWFVGLPQIRVKYIVYLFSFATFDFCNRIIFYVLGRKW